MINQLEFWNDGVDCCFRAHVLCLVAVKLFIEAGIESVVDPVFPRRFVYIELVIQLTKDFSDELKVDQDEAD